MTLINEVKEALCRTGNEMDADDIADRLSWLRRRTMRAVAEAGDQVLQTPAASDGDIVRVRRGLYRHQPAQYHDRAV